MKVYRKGYIAIGGLPPISLREHKVEIKFTKYSEKTYVDGVLCEERCTWDNKGNLIPRKKIGAFSIEECIEMGIDPDVNPYFIRR